MRGGVPVLKRADSSPSASSCSASWIAGGSPARPPAMRVSVPMCSRPRRKVPAVITTAAAPKRRPSSVSIPVTRPPESIDEQSRDRSLNRVELGLLLDERANRAPVHPAIALRARRPHRRPLAAIEHAELQRRHVGRARHDAAQRIDLASDRPLGDAADGGIARHLADGLERARHEPDARAESRRGNGCLGACVTGADDNDVKLELDRMRSHRSKIR